MARTARRDGAQTRRAVLDAARALAGELGWEQVTMRRIAERIGLSPMAAYKHFASREAILLELLREGFALLERAMLTAAAGHDDPVSALYASADAYLDFAEQHRDLYLVMYDLGGVHLPAAETWREGTAIGQVVADLLTRIGRPADALGNEVLGLWSTLHGAIALDAAGRLPAGTATVRRLAHAHVDAQLAT